MDKLKKSVVSDINHDSDHEKKIYRGGYTNTQILIHNIPLFSMYILGVLLLGLLHIILAIIFIIYLIISNLLFMISICVYCSHYGTRTSLCGYALVTKHLAKRKSPKKFKGKFIRHIGVIVPNWFVPFIAGIYLLMISFSWLVLVLLIIFSIIGFIIVPYLSRSKACEKCKLKDQCPWMSLRRR